MKLLYILFVLVVFIAVFALWKTYYYNESFTVNMNQKPDIQEPYETIDLTKFAEKSSLDELLKDTKYINCKTPVIYYKNGHTGFGSQLTLFTQFAECVSKSSPDAICVPWFTTNNGGFQYAEPGVMNSFFLYFKANNGEELANRVKSSENVFVVNNAIVLECSPFFKSELPIMSVPQNNSQITQFRKQFSLRIGDELRNEMQQITTKPLIGIHLRSDAQKKAHEQSYLNGGSILTRFSKLKEKLDNKYQTKYSIFIASDTNLYVKKVKEQLGKNDLYFIDNITRIEDESDSMPNIQKSGYEIGCNILYDCLAMSLCDEIYVSPSNIMFIIACIADDPNVKMNLL